MSKASTATRDPDIPDDDDYSGNFHVYEPYKAGIPRLKPYLRELWRRREFLNEMTRANIRADNLDTWFGQIWNILGPLLMACTYFLLIWILTRGGDQKFYFQHLLAGIFLFSILQQAMNSGASSVTKAGKMITNTAFPRVLLPLSSVRLALARLWPCLAVLAVACLGAKIWPTWALLACIPLFIFYVLLCAGVAMFVATIQVYFRDAKGFIPFFARIWMFTSPVLWMASQIPPQLKSLEWLNPMFYIVSGWSEAIVFGEWPPAAAYPVSAAWSIAIFLIGGYVFLSRERDFAVRI